MDILGAFGSISYGSGVDYYLRGGASAQGRSGAPLAAAQQSRGAQAHGDHGPTNYYTGGAAKGEPPGHWGGKGAAKLGLTGEINAADMKRLYEKGLDPRDAEGRTRYGAPPRGYRTAHSLVLERVGKGLVSEDRIAELREVANASADEPRKAEAILENLVGAEVGMLREQVEAVRTGVSREVRNDNRFADYTFSPSKDISVMHTAAEYGQLKAQREGRHEDASRYQYVKERIEYWGGEGNRAAVDYLNQHAGYVRTGRHPGGTWTEARDWVVATFPQLTSRAGDPQLHWHNPIYLPTETEKDGEIRKLHTTLLQQNKHAAAAVGGRVMMEGLAKDLGWTSKMRTDGNCYELDNVSQEIKDWFSHGSQTISAHAQRIIDEYRETHGHDPIPLAVTRIKQNLALSTRAPKSDTPESREEMHARWDDELRAEIGAGMARQALVAGRVLPAPVPDTFSPDAVIKTAIARVQEGKSTWQRSDLAVEIERALPPCIGMSDAREVTSLIDSMTDVAINRPDLVAQVSNQPTTLTVPQDQLLGDGTSAYVQPGSTRYASREHIASEYALQRATVVRGRASVDGARVDRWIDERPGMQLGADQRAALRGVATSGAAVSVIIGPAGTGKTYVAGGLGQAWSDLAGGRLVGLATSEQATEVLRGERIMSKNIAQWLGAQKRIAEGRASQEDEQFRVGPRDVIMPDEASMADTDKIAEIRGYVEKAGARLLLIGDHRQLSAVGAGGAMSLVAGTEGADVYELREVRRFVDAEGEVTEEGPKSLDLRNGDVRALDWYDMHDRIRTGGTAQNAAHMAARMYTADRLAGKTSVVVTPTNQLAAVVNGIVRDKLVEAGRVSPEGVHLNRDGNMAGVGDLVKCRQNDWSNKDNPIRNQGRYLVTGINLDGGLALREEGTGREIIVSKSYVDQWVELGYAGTVHAAQGSTMGTGIAIVDQSQPAEALYPAMTRGRERNTAIVITVKEYEGQETGQTHERDPRDAKGILADILERDNEAAKSALALSAEDAARAHSMATINRRYEDAVGHVVHERTADWLDRLTYNGTISEDDRSALAADQGMVMVGRLLRSVEQAGHDPRVALRDALAGKNFDGARSPAQVLYSRINQAYRDQLSPDLERAEVPPLGASKEYEQHLDELQDMGRLRRMELGEQAAEEQPGWAVEALGWRPEDRVARAEWEHKAGVIAAQREAAGWTHPTNPLPPAPGLLHPEQRLAWYQAHEAAGKPDATAEETVLSEGALRVRVEAMRREIERMPPSQYEQMRAVERELKNHEDEAALARGRLDNEPDDQARALLTETAEAAERVAARMRDKLADIERTHAEREQWRDETAVTRELGERAMKELADRQVPLDQEPDRVTAAEWLEEHRKAMAAEDPHRRITEVDAPSEVWDDDAQDLVQLADRVEEAPPAQPAAAVAEVDNVVDVAHEEVARQLTLDDAPRADEPDVVVAEVVDEQDEDAGAGHQAGEPARAEVVDIVDEEGDAAAQVPAQQEPDVVDAQVVEDQPEAEAPDEEEKAAIEEPADDVPSDEEVALAAAQARVAADELDDRHSLEQDRETRVGYRHAEVDSSETAQQDEDLARHEQSRQERDAYADADAG